MNKCTVYIVRRTECRSAFKLGHGKENRYEIGTGVNKIEHGAGIMFGRGRSIASSPWASPRREHRRRHPAASGRASFGSIHRRREDLQTLRPPCRDPRMVEMRSRSASGRDESGGPSFANNGDARYRRRSKWLRCRQREQQS